MLPNNTYTHKAIILTILILTFSYISTAQPKGTTKGREFYCSFLPNYHENARREDDITRLADSLYIFMTADSTASGIIYSTNRNGNELEFPFEITNPKQNVSFAVPWQGYELEGWNNHGVPANDTINQEGRVAKQHFRIVSNNDISVYALIQASRSSDAFLVFPVKALGNEYRILTYSSDGFTTPNTSTLDASSTPSEFQITATEDNTHIIINPLAATYRHGLAADTAILQHGETYLVQAKITKANLHPDLTGSKITSDKPIAVFAGHQRALLPVELRNTTSSRDHLAEQMPPVSSWGNNAILIPYPQPSNITPYGKDLFRVLAAYDTTEIYYGGEKKTMLSAGQYFTDSLITASELRASKPILVAQFKKTSTGIGSTDAHAISDPLMMIIPSSKQFLKTYKWVSIKAKTAAADTSIYVAQYITVVAPKTTNTEVLLDDSPVPIDSFVSILGSEFMYANLKVSDGAHMLSANKPVGVYVYGYGAVNSYGYVAGMNFENSTNDVYEQSEPAGGILLSPNPVSTSFTVSGIEGVSSLTMINSIGMEVFYQKEVNNRENIDITMLQNGLYFVSIRTGGKVVVKPIIVCR